MKEKTFFIIPEQYIPEQKITRCEDCPDFEYRGGSYGEYHACRNDDYPGYDSDIHLKVGKQIPDNCPRL